MKKKLIQAKVAIPRKLYISFALVSFVLMMLGWWILSFYIEAFFLPSPVQVLRAAKELWTTHHLLSHIGYSTWRVVMGWLWAVLLAVPLGLIMGTFQFVEALLEPLNDFIRYMPVVAFIPLAILWIGIGDVEKMLIIFLGTFFQLLIMVADIAASTPNTFLEVARTLGYREWAILWRLIWPKNSPMIYDSLRVTMGWAWSYLVVAELVAASRGIGYLIIQSQRFLKTDQVIASIIIIGLIGLGFDYIFKFFYPRLFPWSLKQESR